MRFVPKPENDFYEFIRTYYRECRGRFPKIQAIAGKWMYRDLVPGMSDFDTRFIVEDGMSAEDWCQMSSVVGQVHLDLCEKHPCWSRNLEHLPGVNLTWTELLSEDNYYPEFKQWTFYDTLLPGKVSDVQVHFSRRPWDIKDEYFHLKRFCTYYGRYSRTIDPPVNLGVHENKYPMHSRIMHYFNPPVHSAVCLIDRKNIPGKMNAFELARYHFPGLRCWDLADELLHANYEIPYWYEEPHLTELEDELEHGLQEILRHLRQTITLVPEQAGLDVQDWKAALQKVPLDPSLLIFDSCKFSRLMKGRLYFYLHAPPYFETLFLIQNELGRIGNNFFKVPFQSYWKIRTGVQVEDPVQILDRLRDDPLSEAEIAATKEFARLNFSDWLGKEKEVVREIVSVYDDFYRALSKITASLSP